jgi:hypothetical protein
VVGQRLTELGGFGEFVLTGADIGGLSMVLAHIIILLHRKRNCLMKIQQNRKFL